MYNYGKSKIYGYWWRLMLKTQALDDASFLKPIFESKMGENSAIKIQEYLNELNQFTALRQNIVTHQKVFQTTFEDLIVNPNTWFLLLYITIRIKKPEIVIETGCATGTTTAIILYALQQNQHGQLYSIDMRFPDDWITRNHLTSGFLVPDDLKSRWSLILRDTKVELPRLLAELGKVDLFLHDSDHDYIYQMWEYLTAWPYIPIGGILASDDIRHNTAFFDFGRQVPTRPLITKRGTNFGMLVKKAENPQY